MSKIVTLVVKRLRASKADQLVQAMADSRTKIADLEGRIEEAQAAIKQFGENHPFAETAKRELPLKKRDLVQAQNAFNKIRTDLRTLINNSIHEVYPLQVWERLVRIQNRCKTITQNQSNDPKAILDEISKLERQIDQLMEFTENSYGPFPTPEELVRTVKKELSEDIQDGALVDEKIETL
ncbi:MAG TPA: hypothetical protein PL033_06980 [Candidatus Brocadiia bacterium]|nr:hypothetical protein [Candidatus Brocadiia bacterium]